MFAVAPPSWSKFANSFHLQVTQELLDNEPCKLIIAESDSTQPAKAIVHILKRIYPRKGLCRHAFWRSAEVPERIAHAGWCSSLLDGVCGKQLCSSWNGFIRKFLGIEELS